MAISVNTVLTAAYKKIYGSDNPTNPLNDDELMLVVAPLSSCDEVTTLFKEGVIDIQTAIPAALHSLGCSASEIQAALARRKESDESKTTGEQAEKDKNDANLNAEVELKTAMAERERANAKKLVREASQPASSSSSASSSKSPQTTS